MSSTELDSAAEGGGMNEGGGGGLRKWIVHAMAFCQNCDKEWLDYKTAMRNAAQHAKKTGHEIHGEQGYAVRFNEPQKEAGDE